MRTIKDTTALTFDPSEKSEYKDAAAAGVLAIESQISSMETLCRWEQADSPELQPIRDYRQRLITLKSRLHDIVVALG